MFFFSIFFLLGDLLLQQFKSLPNPYGLTIFLILFFIPTKKLKTLFFAFTMGFLWTYFYAQHQLAWQLPDALEGKNISVIGYIASIPDASSGKASFLMALKKMNNHSANGFVKLSWRYPKQKLIVGDRWHLNLHLKKIHGLMNPGGFDYEKWAFQENIKAQGYVVDADENQILQSHWYHDPINRIRQKIKENITSLLPPSETSPWITALAVGERKSIDQDKWEVLRKTGTNHLMAIAGLHIGFMSGLLYFLVSWIWRRVSSLALRFPAQHAGSIAALGMAFIYSALSGFNIPAQRASIMISVFLIFTLLKRKIPAWHAWSVALLIVLLMNPLTILSESFWLSFGSVALIIYGMSNRLSPKSLWWKYGRIQWVIALGLIPLSIALFQQFSLVSFVANSIAIPWVACIIVPLTLCACFLIGISAKLSAIIFFLADKNLQYLWKLLAWLAHFSWATWFQFIPYSIIIVIAMVGIFLLLLPKGFPGRWFGIIWLLPLLMFRPNIPKEKEIYFTLLDVGQGLSAIIQTQHHVLIFDTGERFGENDSGQSVIIPYLRTVHLNKIDKLIVSDNDNGYLGGVISILKTISVKEMMTIVPELFVAQHATSCQIPANWQWDGVQFNMLSTEHSCVLKIVSGNESILLTGNLNASEENKLLKNNNPLQATILLVPHYGSKSAFSKNFLHAVDSQIALFSVGCHNRFHYPNQEVEASYKNKGEQIYNTADSGAIHIEMDTKQIQKIELYRRIKNHYWQMKIC